MTAIAGFIDKKNKRTLLASDSAGSNKYTTDNFKTKKLLRISDDVSMAFTGSYRVINVMEHKLKLRKFQEDESVDEYVFEYLADEIIKVLRENHIIEKDKEIEKLDSIIILAVRDRIFKLQTDGAVLEPITPYIASGSGQYHTESAIAVLSENTDYDCKSILTKAINIASRYVMSVGGEIHILEHKHK